MTEFRRPPRFCRHRARFLRTGRFQTWQHEMIDETRSDFDVGPDFFLILFIAKAHVQGGMQRQKFLTDRQQFAGLRNQCESYGKKAVSRIYHPFATDCDQYLQSTDLYRLASFDTLMHNSEKPGIQRSKSNIQHIIWFDKALPCYRNPSAQLLSFSLALLGHSTAHKDPLHQQREPEQMTDFGKVILAK